MGRQKFPEFEVWQAMSEGEQDALMLSDVFTSLEVAAFVTATMIALLYLLSSQMR